MKFKPNIYSIGFISSVLFSYSAFASTHSLKGEYKVVYGGVKTMEVSNPLANEAPEQLGRYSVWLVKADWDSLSSEEKVKTKYLVKMQGTLRGQVNPLDFTARHTMVGDSRSYIIRSEGDVLFPISGDPFCSTGEPMQVREQVNLVSGSGTYANLTSGSIMLEGIINNCPHLEDFGKNDFKVIPSQSSIVFE
ncbi:hypothetical protein OPS25_07700 [Alteromonas ponticola]|uniref:Uncharacterized protein n=1 Tax=Alteromonas aquimaris TaxID=2998417 RepID=A0ABT3P8G2_9ALTE|nr:hypothetical protein [Alteromonas aquimaris]MCW8108376.1 hypothetical protein [Alteromonas aquimaris]